MADERVPIEKVLSGMSIHPMPESWSVLEAFVLVKCLDEDGVATWSYRTTASPNREELLGVLLVQAELLKQELLSQWNDDEQ